MIEQRRSPNRTFFCRGHFPVLAAVMIALISCAPAPDDRGYAKYILDRPPPANGANKTQECDFLLREITRQKAVAQALPANDLLPETALAIQKATQTNIDALKLRATQLSCPPPDSTELDQ